MKDTKVKIELETGRALTSVKDLRKALKEAKDEMVGLEEGSKAFNDAANRAGELKHQLDVIREGVSGASSDFGDMVGQAAKLGAGLTGAFQAAEGAMSLFGVESENVTKAIQKMQSIMAITQGLSAIDSGIKAYKKLNTVLSLSIAARKAEKTATEQETVSEVKNTASKVANSAAQNAGISAEQKDTAATLTNTAVKEASTVATWSLVGAAKTLWATLSANPLGVLLAAITAIIAGVSYVIDKWDDWTGKTEKHNKLVKESEARLNNLDTAINGHKKALDKLADSQDFELSLLKAQGKSTDELSRKEIEFTKTKIKETQKRIKAAQEEYRTALLKEAASSGVVAQKNGDSMTFGYVKTGEEEEDKRREAASKRLAEAYKSIQEMKAAEIKLNQQLQIQEATLATEQRKAAAEAAKQAAKDAKQKEKDAKQAAKDAAKAKLDAAKTAEEKRKAEYEYKQTLLDIQKLENDVEGVKKLENEKVIEEERLTLMQEYLGKLKEGTQEYVNQEKAILNQQNAIKNLAKDIDDTNKAIAQAKQDRLNVFNGAGEREKTLTEAEQLEVEKQERIKEIELAYKELADEEKLELEEQYKAKLEALDLEYRDKKKKLDTNAEIGAKQETLNKIAEASQNLSNMAGQFDMISDGWGAGFDALTATISQASEAMQVFGDEGATAGDKAAAGLQVAGMAAQGIGNILTALAKEQDANTKEGFERQKKLQIAAATMQMLGGITTALSGAFTAKSGPWDYILAGIQATTIAAMGGVQIAKIKNTKFDGGASSGASSANLSSTARALSSPVTYTQDVENAETIGAITDTKVYVTETDITDTQNKVNIAETESTF